MPNHYEHRSFSGILSLVFKQPINRLSNFPALPQVCQLYSACILWLCLGKLQKKINDKFPLQTCGTVHCALFDIYSLATDMFDAISKPIWKLPSRVSLHLTNGVHHFCMYCYGLEFKQACGELERDIDLQGMGLGWMHDMVRR